MKKILSILTIAILGGIFAESASAQFFRNLFTPDELGMNETRHTGVFEEGTFYKNGLYTPDSLKIVGIPGKIIKPGKKGLVFNQEGRTVIFDYGFAIKTKLERPSSIRDYFDVYETTVYHNISGISNEEKIFLRELNYGKRKYSIFFFEKSIKVETHKRIYRYTFR